MPATAIPNFIGGSYTGTEQIVDVESTINWYPEFAPSKTAAKNALLCCPGYTPFVGLPSAPVRGLLYQDGRTFAVSGNLFCEILATQTFIVRGTVAVDANPATIVSNGLSQGHQIFVVSGGRGYIYDLVSNAFTDVTSQSTFPAPAISGFYLDGYFGAIQANAPTFALSNLFDGTTWNILQGGEQSLSLTVDNIQNGTALNGLAWFMGSKNTEVWSDIGTADFPLSPIPGAVPRWGLDGPFTMAVLDNALMGVGVNEDGSRAVVRSSGYNFSAASTPSISRMLDAAPSLQGAIAWSYAMDGHAFYLLSVPTLPTTLVYDIVTGLWHERALWNPALMQWTPDLGRCHAYGFNQHLVGDRQSGTVYTMSNTQLSMNVVLT